MKSKRILILFACMLLTFSACSDSKNIRGTISSAETSAEESSPSGEKKATQPEEEGIGASDDGKSQGEGSESSDATQAEDAGNSTETVDISLGHSANNTYENSFTGIGCKLDDSWTFLTDEQIQSVNKITADLAGEEFKKALENASVLYDMMATQSETSNSLNVTFEKLPILYYTMSGEQYAELGMDKLSKSLQNMGFQNLNLEISKTKFLGEDTACVKVFGTYEERALYEILVPVNCHGYMVLYSISSIGTDETEKILESFYRMN